MISRVRLLIAARARLVKGQNSMICLAIQEAAPTVDVDYTTVTYLLDYITKSLHPHTTLAQWQWSQGLVDRDLLADRIAYIDWMIESYAK